MQQSPAYLTNKVPPQDLEAERAVLGSCLLSGEAVSESVNAISPEDFYSPAHNTIFSAVSKLFEGGSPIDTVTIMNYLRSVNKIDEVGGPAYLGSLLEVPSSASRVRAYCEVLRDKSKARSLIAIAGEIIGGCYDGGDAKQIIDQLGGRFFDIAVDRRNATESIGEISTDVFHEIEERFKNKNANIGIPTGFTDIDRMLHGFADTELIILAGRPAMGKTTLALNIINNVVEAGWPTLFFSLEMSKREIGLKQMSLLSGVDFDTLQTGRLDDGDWPKITRAKGMMNAQRLYIDDSSALSITQIRARARLMVARFGIKFVVVDYLGLCRAKAENREREVSEISSGLKAMAKDLNVPVLALSQLNRGLESRTDKRPMLSDLRDSGSIEQDANMVLFIYRDEVYNKSEDNPLKGFAEVITAKNRRGATGKSTLLFDGAKCRFDSYANWSE